MDMDQEEIVRKKKNENVTKCRKSETPDKKTKGKIAARETNIKAHTNKLNFLTDVVKAHTEASGVAIMENFDFGEQNNIIENVPNGDTQADGSDSWNVPKVGLTNKNLTSQLKE